MAMWYYARNDKQVGPISLEQLQALVRSGELQAQDRVWGEGMADWVTVGNVPELQAVLPAAPGAGAAFALPVQPLGYESNGPKAPGSERDWMAVTALVLGILSVPCSCSPICGIVFQIPAIIFGSLGLKSTKRGMAMAGLILACVGIALDIASAIFGAYMATHDPSNPIYKMMHTPR